jgi:hypothetical protein
LSTALQYFSASFTVASSENLELVCHLTLSGKLHAMKKNLFAFVIASVLFSTVVQSQSLDKKTVQLLVEARAFVFIPQSMTPSGGSSRPVTQDYDVRLAADSIVTYLPYYGRSYVPVLPGEGGVNFTSTEFDYKARMKKKKWEVSVTPEDTKEVRQLHFTIFENGYATLFVNSMNKQPVSYYGYIRKIH